MATSLDLELDGRKASRQAVTESIWTNFLRLYKEFMLTEDLSGILEEYNARLVNVGQEVRILDPLGEYTAISQGIDATGALLVKTGSGEIKRVDSGEVSVRGIYGYV
jgi:BirA family biotin operon repressor/biotin-[acetyl-CoA-carboxylase] ligase